MLASACDDGVEVIVRLDELTGSIGCNIRLRHEDTFPNRYAFTRRSLDTQESEDSDERSWEVQHHL